MLQCEWCGTVFEDKLEYCPVCKSQHAVGYEMENPVSRLPMEGILRVTGHLVWVIGLIGGLIFFWNTDQANEHTNFMLMIGGIACIALSIVLSILFFGMSELLQRIIRIQRRVRAFSSGYHVASKYWVNEGQKKKAATGEAAQKKA